MVDGVTVDTSPGRISTMEPFSSRSHLLECECSALGQMQLLCVQSQTSVSTSDTGNYTSHVRVYTDCHCISDTFLCTGANVE